MPACHDAHLIHDDVVRVNLKLAQLLNQSLSFVQREELRDAHANEGRRVRVMDSLLNRIDHPYEAQR